MFTEIGKSGEATARREASLKKMEFERKKSFFEDRGLQRTQKSDCQPSYDDLDEEFPEEVLEAQCLISAQTVSFYAQLHSEKQILLYTVPLDRRSEVEGLY